jgi:EAL domain-containing protein (putative c-di-GMP-specific phosphodiesterase class I)
VGEAQLLVVDDERMVRDAIARLFRDTEIEVTLAHDGAHAVELLRHKHFDAVITDVHMPNLSGIELLKAIHIDDAEIPVIITTGEPTTESAIQALDNGAVRYLLKPIDGGELVKAVSNAIGMRRLAVFHRQAALVASRTPAVDEIADLDGAFDRAIAGLFAHYQPIISLPDRRVVAYEALARTNETSFPHPGALFDAAERLDRVASVGRRMRVAAPIPFEGRSEQLFINLHPMDLLDESLFDPKSPLAMMASQVVLEITERASLSSVGDLRDRITRLRNIGYRIAVDDLGAGYAGLSAFVALSPDFVKLDMSLVRDVHRSTTQQRLIHSLLAVCKDLDIRVVSEGVETPEELATLRDLGCELFQGFLFARPGLGLTLEPNWG